MTAATITQLNAEIATRKAADATNATAITAEGKARLVGDKLALEQVAALAARIAKLEAPIIVPAPDARPFAPPVTARTVDVPSTIDPSGVGDVTASLTAFFASVPDGSVIAFPAGATYKTTGLTLSGRHDLIFEGRGTKLHQTGSADALLRLVSCTGIALRSLPLEAENPNPGTVVAFRTGGSENAHGISLRGSDCIEIDRVTARAIWGDGVYLEAWAGDADWCDKVWIHDSVIDGAGRNGITINSARDVWVSANSIGRIQMHAIDFEPNNAAGGAERVAIMRNTFGTYGWNSSLVSFLLAIVGADGALGRDIEFSGNTVAGGLAGYDGKALALNSIVWRSRLSGIKFTDNIGLTPASGAGWPGGVLHFQQVDGLTVARNVQPLSAGVLMSITDCTGVA